MAAINWRTINIDALDPDSPANFDLSSLTPAVTPVSTADVQNYAAQIRQLLRGGDNEGALQAALENPPYGADEKGKVRCGMLPHHHTLGTPDGHIGIPLADVSPYADVARLHSQAVTAASGSRPPGRGQHTLHRHKRLTGFTAL
jgi:hypothetical protein